MKNKRDAPDRAGSEAQEKKTVIHGLELGNYDPEKGFPKGKIVIGKDGRAHIELLS